MASKINKGEILAKFFDDGEYTALFADGAVSAACGYAAGQQLTPFIRMARLSP